MGQKIIESILQKNFSDDIQGAIDILKRYNFYDPLEQRVYVIYSKLSNNRIESIEILATSLFQTINSKLGSIKNENDKEFCEYILIEIGISLFLKYYENKQVTYKDLERLKNGFKSVCEIEGYNYKELNEKLNIEGAIRFLKVESNKNTTVKYYDWNGGDESLNLLVGDLKSNNVIKQVSEFKKLFTPQPEQVRINLEYSEYVFILFDELYEKDIISPRGQKGHFSCLATHAVDFEEKKLYKKSPNQIKYTIKKNTSKYRELKDKTQKRINGIEKCLQ